MNAHSASAASAERPFPGLRPFAFRDHKFFFGRTEQTYSLYQLVDQNCFIAVVGSSGTGKSSLVRAGLLPLLQEETQDGGGRTWLWRVMRPGNAPLLRLAAALAKLGNDDFEAGTALEERIRFDLRRSSFGIADALTRINRQGASLLLVVDQFEELFRYSLAYQRGASSDGGTSPDDAVKFVQLLLTAARDRSLDVHVLITMRSDFIGDCARFQELPEAVSAAQFLVPALTRDQREEVIRRPIETSGAAIEPALVERLLNDGGDDPDQLPVLQHCLLRLWERAGQAPEIATASVNQCRELKLDHYPEVGRISGALSQHADEILSTLPGLELVAEQVFRALSETDKEGRVTRRAVPFGQLCPETGMPDADLRRVIDQFRADDCSFLTPPESDAPTLDANTPVDVAHEALLRRWNRVSADAVSGTPGWLHAEEADGRLYRVLLSMADSEGAAIPKGQVEERWRWWNSRTRTAAWADRYGGNLERVERLLNDSRAALEAERISKRNGDRRRMAAAAVILTVALTSAGFMYWQWQVAKHHQHVAQKNKENAEKNLRLALGSPIKVLKKIHEYLNTGAIPTYAANNLLATAEEILNELEKVEQTPVVIAGRSYLLIQFSDAHLQFGNSREALVFAQEAKRHAEQVVTVDPNNDDWQYLIYASAFRIGDSVRDREQQLQEYKQALGVAEHLSNKYPARDYRHSDIAFVLNKIGDVFKIKRDLPEALANYNKALALISEISAKAPENKEWRRDLATTLTRIGDVSADQGNVEGALQQYHAALDIRKSLADGFRHDDSIRSNLSVGYNRLGDMLKRLEKFDEAAVQYEKALAIRKGLADKDPSNATWQSHLGWEYLYIGDLLMARNDAQGALEQYRKSLPIREALVQKDPDHPEWQRNLAAIRERVRKASGAPDKTE